jgi:hypothetical protein
MLPPGPLTRRLPPPDPRSLCPLSSTEFVEPLPNKIPGYATGDWCPKCYCPIHLSTNEYGCSSILQSSLSFCPGAHSHKQIQLMKSTEIPQVDKHEATVNEWQYNTDCKLMCFPAPDLASFQHLIFVAYGEQYCIWLIHIIYTLNKQLWNLQVQTIKPKICL